MSITIEVNGASREVKSGTTLSGLLSDLGIREGHVAVELNLKIVGKEEYLSAKLSQGDKIEIISFVGGGA